MVDTDQIDKVLDAVKRGFKTISKDPTAFARNTNVLLLQDVKTGIRIDLVFTFIEFEREPIEKADSIGFKGRMIKCV